MEVHETKHRFTQPQIVSLTVIGFKLVRTQQWRATYSDWEIYIYDVGGEAWFCMQKNKEKQWGPARFEWIIAQYMMNTYKPPTAKKRGRPRKKLPSPEELARLMEMFGWNGFNGEVQVSDAELTAARIESMVPEELAGPEVMGRGRIHAGAVMAEYLGEDGIKELLLKAAV